MLLAAAGVANDIIAARLDTPRQIVSKWRKRFARAQCDFGHANGPRIGLSAVMLLNWKPQRTNLLTGKYSTPSAYM